MKNNKTTVHHRLNFWKLLLIISFCLPTFQAYSLTNEAYSQQVNLSINLENKTLQEVFDFVEKNSEFIFFYKKDALDTQRKVSVNLSDKPITVILDEILAGTNIRYEINDRQISLKKANKEIRVDQENGFKVQGIIKDSKGETAIGANILVKGTQMGVSTDANGAFTLYTPSSKSVLVVSYLGYKTQEVKIDGKSNLAIVLEEDAEALDEVVAIGYGRQKKSSLISSINTITNKEIKLPTRNLTNNLAGQIAGLIAVQRSGEPGYDDAEFWIRGVSSFKGGTNPLILVDGIPRNMNDIEPDEIETFSLLKDAAATAVYGAEGANGVILITSKRGRIQKPKFNFRAEGSMLQPTRLPEFMGAKDFMDAYNEARYNEGLDPFYSQDLVAKYASHEDLDLYPDVNWMDLLRDNTSNQRYTLGVRGGSDRARYFVSGAFFTENGIFKSNDMENYDTNIGVKRYNLRSNIDLDVSKTTILNIDLSGQYLTTNYPGRSTDEILGSITHTAPNQIPMVYSDGTLAGQLMPSGNRNNPYNYLMNSGYTKEWRTGIQSKVTIDQKLDFITKGLSARGSISFDVNVFQKVKRLKNPSTYNASGRDENDKLIFKEVVAGSEDLVETITATNNKQIYMEVAANYHRIFNDVHEVTGMALFMQKEKSFKDDNVTLQSLPFRKQSFVGRAAYSYDNRYFMEGSFGYTGSENFADGYRFGFFPAVGAAWFISQEKFYPEALTSVMNKLKIRASYGRTGNDDTGGTRFMYRETLKTDGPGYNIGIIPGGSTNGAGGGILEAQFASPFLSWEIEDKQNYGVDLGFFNNRVDLQIDYFTNKRNNILLQRETVSGMAGFQQSPWQNFGVVTNKGMDASVVLNQQLGELKLSARGNLTWAHNKVIERDEVTPAYPWMSKTGIPLNSWNLYIAEGLYAENDFDITGTGKERVYKLKEGVVKSGLTTDIRPGDIKYKDMNGDGTINSYDQVQNIGNPSVPEIVYGFGFNAEYKGFYAGIFFQGAGKTSTVLGANSGADFHPFTWGLEETSVRNVVADRWSESNQSQDVMFPRLRTKSHPGNSVPSTWWQRDASFIRLKNVEIGYNLPKKVIKHWGMDGIRVYLMGNNLAVWDKIKMWDPEMGNKKEGLSYPLPRTFTLGLEVSF